MPFSFPLPYLLVGFGKCNNDPPKEFYVLISGSYKYSVLFRKRILVSVIKGKNRSGRPSWTIQMGPN